VLAEYHKVDLDIFCFLKLLDNFLHYLKILANKENLITGKKFIRIFLCNSLSKFGQKDINNNILAY
jgi:hypothetical protein